MVLNCLPPTSHPPNPHINWFFNYSKILTSSRYHYVANGSLVITGTQRQDNGVYFCQAVNVFSKVARTSTIATVNILGKFDSWKGFFFILIKDVSTLLEPLGNGFHCWKTFLENSKNYKKSRIIPVFCFFFKGNSDFRLNFFRSFIYVYSLYNYIILFLAYILYLFGWEINITYLNSWNAP